MFMIWNASKLEQAADCLFKCYLINVEKEKYPMTGPMTKGRLLHSVTETNKFFKEDGTPYYKSPESFTNATAAKWKYILRQVKEGKQEIDWKYKEEPWKILNDIEKMAPAIYRRYASEDPPVYCEKPFDMEVDGRCR